jgi:hypothetical protein
VPALLLLAILLSIARSSAGGPQVIDCIVAEVGDQIVTLTDVRILKAFSIGRDYSAQKSAAVLSQILNDAVDRKVILSLVRENIAATDEEVSDQMSILKAPFDPGQWVRKLEEFGLAEDDLKPYLKEIILFNKIIGLRFSQSSEVGLQEIETYYSEVYLPSQQAQGQKPKPMVQILTELEARIKSDKTQQQVNDWIQSLRTQAEVRINDRCLEKIR